MPMYVNSVVCIGVVFTDPTVDWRPCHKKGNCSQRSQYHSVILNFEAWKHPLILPNPPGIRLTVSLSWEISRLRHNSLSVCWFSGSKLCLCNKTPPYRSWILKQDLINSEDTDITIQTSLSSFFHKKRKISLCLILKRYTSRQAERDTRWDNSSP